VIGATWPALRPPRSQRDLPAPERSAMSGRRDRLRAALLAAPATLFVADLDGTLLSSDVSLSETTVGMINDLIAAGGLFTCATARSPTSTREVTRRLSLQLPLITSAGAVIADPTGGQPHIVASLPAPAVKALQQAAAVPGSRRLILFTMHQGRDRACWLASGDDEHVTRLFPGADRDPRLLPLTSWSQIEPTQIFYAMVAGEPRSLEQLHAELAASLAGCDVALTQCVHTGLHCLALTSAASTKATAVEYLRAEVSAARLICFGDSPSDLPMLRTADVGVAVGNASPAVRAGAAETTASNDDDGVAQWIYRYLAGFGYREVG
jgi:5-amino-6-(5-phospho-D-ribitylamino)uracil phosphatase